MRYVAILILGFVSVAPDCVVGQDEVDRLIGQLGGEDAQARYEAYRQLRGHKTPAALAALAKSLPKFAPYAQSLGLSLVFSFPDPKRDTALRGFLKGKPSLLRLGAAVWLLQRGDQAATRHIVQCLRTPGESPALNLMLGRLWNVKAPSVVQAVQDHVRLETDLTTLGTALRMLARAKARGAIPRVQRIVAEKAAETDRRALCLAFLLVMGEAEHSQALADAIPKIESWTRLQLLLKEASYLDKTVLAAILEFADGQEGLNARYALELLALHAYRPAVPKMREWLTSGDSERSKASLAALMTMGEGLPLEDLRTLLSSDIDALCVSAADALRRMDDDSGLPRLIELIEHGSSARFDAVQALGKFRDRRAVPVLIRMLDDANSSVRMQAFNGLPVIFRGLFPYRRFDFAATGYNYSGPAAGRRAAIAQIQKWWSAQAGEK